MPIKFYKLKIKKGRPTREDMAKKELLAQIIDNKDISDEEYVYFLNELQLGSKTKRSSDIW